MNVTGNWTDDHLPCVSFKHNGTTFEVLWTSRDLIGRLQLVEEGSVTVEAALEKYKGLLAVINNPLNASFASTDEGEPEDKAFWEEGQAEYQTDAGYVTVDCLAI